MGLDTPSESRKKIALIALAGLLLLVGGYATGRYAAPAKTVVTEKVVTVDKEVVVTKVDTDAVLNAIKTLNLQKNVHVVRVTEKDPDGVTKTTVTTDDKSTTQTQSTTQAKVDTQTQQTATKTETQTLTLTKTVERATRPTWSFVLQPGVDFAAVSGKSTYNLLPSSANPVLKYTVIGASVEHQLLGPVYTGVWFNSQLSGGLVLRLDL